MGIPSSMSSISHGTMKVLSLLRGLTRVVQDILWMSHFLGFRREKIHILGTSKGGLKYQGDGIVSIQKCHSDLRCQVLHSWNTCFPFSQTRIAFFDRWSCSSNGEVLSFFETCLYMYIYICIMSILFRCSYTRSICLKHIAPVIAMRDSRRTVQRMEALEA